MRLLELFHDKAHTEEYARTVAASADTINYNHVNLWIQYCEQHHGAKCNRRELDSLCTNEVDIILIDVRRKCLVRSTTASRYFALSYVWGSVSQLQATTSNFESLTVHQALQRHRRAIPRVIKDAMEAVYSLRETYLWVDSLCILQDDASVKHHQIAHMAAIYSGAILTIAAIAARDTNSSLPGVVSGTRWPRSWKSDQCHFNRPLRPDLVLKAIGRSLYVSRGWTFQERHLSRRSLYFLDEQIYFQCRTELWCEEPPLETGILSRLTLNSNDLDLGLSLLARAPGWVENIRKKEWDRAFAFYVEIIHEYSWKRLSYSYDVMNAFSGILSALEEYSGWSFPHGLPEALFDYALMWVPADVVERRPPAPSGPNRHFPSWSWCGWIGGVSFNVVFDKALQSLRSRIGRAEIELHDALVPTFRPLKRSVIEKDDKHDRERTTAFVELETLPSSDKQPTLSLGYVLSLTAATVSAYKFQTRQMPPWWRDPSSSRFYEEGAIFADKRATSTQTGISLLSSMRVCGLLYGINSDQLNQHAWASLRMMLMSVSKWPPIIKFTRLGHFDDPKAQDDNRSWTYDRPDGQWRTYNFMLIERKGLCYERVAVGQMHDEAWEAANPYVEDIKLA